LLKKPPALRTENGVFLLDRIHLEKKVPVEEFPREISIGTGSISLAAWHPL